MTIKDSKYVKVNNVNPLYLNINKMNRCFKEINGNKYLKLVRNDESKEKIKKFEELWNKIRDLIRAITKKSDDYGEKYMKIKFDSDDDLSLIKTIEICSMIKFARDVFHQNNKYYPEVLFDECLNKL